MNNLIVWIFGSEHEVNPFIKLGIEALTRQGSSVILVDLKNKRFPRKTLFSSSGKQDQLIDEDLVKPDASIIRGEKVQNPVGRVTYTTRVRKFLKSIKAVRDFGDGVILPFVYKVGGGIFDFSVFISYKSAQTRLVITSLFVLLKHRPVIVISSNPYFLMVAALYRVFHRCRLVYYPFELTGEQVKKPMFLELEIEKWLIRSKIDNLITQNECRAEVYKKERRVRIKPVIVHNYKTIKPGQPVLSRNEVFQKFGYLPGQHLIVYEGYLVPGRNLENLVLALKFLEKNTRMLFIGMGNKIWWAETMEPIINLEEIRSRFTRLPFTTGDELHAIISAADMGVILYDNTCRNNYFCEPGKLSDYLQAGVPVIVPDFPTIRPTVEGHKIGVCIEENSSEAIAKAAVSILSKPRGEWAHNISIARDSLTWETQEPNFIGAVIGLQKYSHP